MMIKSRMVRWMECYCACGESNSQTRVPFIRPNPKRSFWAAEGQNDTKIDFKVIGFEVVG